VNVVATYRVAELGVNGWIRVESSDGTSGRRTWLNVARVTIIEDATPEPAEYWAPTRAPTRRTAGVNREP